LITAIETSITEFLELYKIKGKKDIKNIGIWVNKKKIAAIGLKVSRWIAYHGFSININNNLEEYLKISPCGLNNKQVTSIYKEKGKKIKNFEKKLIEITIKNMNKI
jgi:lipoyl(octanoyl) transferase